MTMNTNWAYIEAANNWAAEPDGPLPTTNFST
jgi:hypothetical protein